MGSSVNFNVMAGFKAIHQWQQNMIRNASGILTPGYNKINTHFGATPAGPGTGSTGPTLGGGSHAGMAGGGDTLMISGTSVEFLQGDINPIGRETALAIKGEGFFLVAENLNKGARVFLTRSGDFHYDAQGRLVNNQGLFVVGGGGTLTDPPTPVIDRRGDGTMTLPDITLGRVNAKSALTVSGYGATIYQVNTATGPIQGFPNGDARVGFVQTHSLEFPNNNRLQTELQVESTEAAQAYKMLKDLLDNYNRATDDALGTVK